MDHPMTTPRKLPSEWDLACAIHGTSHMPRGVHSAVKLILADRNAVLEAAAEVAEKTEQTGDILREDITAAIRALKAQP